jgi:Carbohydrate esterase, sialic acid-specific acetylesterase
MKPSFRSLATTWATTWAPCAALAIFATSGCGVQAHQHAEPRTSSGTGGTVTAGGSGGSVGGVGVGGRSGGAGASGAGIGGSSGNRDAAAPDTAPATDAATASGITININGTLVPKEKAIVFIHFGHSNMRGQASTPASLHGFFYDTQPQLWVYQGSNRFVLAKEETAPEDTVMTTAGPGMALLRTAAAAAPSDYHFISIGRGNGSSPSTEFLKGGVLYSAFMNRALELKGKVTFGGIFVMLGITERHLPTADQPGYPARVKQIIADIRADLGEPNLPVLYCDYEMMATGDLAPTGVVGRVVLPLTRMLPGLIDKLVLVPTDGLEMQDDHHFDFAGHKLWSERAIMLMQSHGWFPWTK